MCACVRVSVCACVWCDSTRAWDEISAETSKEEVENLLRAYNEERKMADEALTNNELAERMLSEGILAVVRGLTSWTGSNPIEMGRPLAVHRVAWDASATERTHFKLSGNGTIMPGDDDHPGLQARAHTLNAHRCASLLGKS